MRANHDAQLVALGWDPWFADRFGSQPATTPARVVADHGTGCFVHTGEAVVSAVLAHRLAALPTVGDWVAVRLEGRQAVIETLLERRTAFRRKAAGAVSEEQVLAANVDVALVVAPAPEPNLRRIERTLAMALSSGARPVVLLNKADLIGEDATRLLTAEVEQIAAGSPVVALSAATGDCVERLPELFPSGRTAVLLGPSGAGKSTLLNRLAGGDLMRTGAIRSDGKGRHTTTHRQLVAMPWGGLLIDTPGLRELQLWADVDGSGGIDELFADIDDLAGRCRFSDCRHAGEPGCAVSEAIARGELSEGRLRSYRKLTGEAEAVRRQVSQRHAREAAVGRRRRIAQLREQDT